jgi:PAS domain S-box-containing protein
VTDLRTPGRATSPVALLVASGALGAAVIVLGGALFGPGLGRALLVSVAALALVIGIVTLAAMIARREARHRRIEAAVRESEAHKAAILASARDAIVSLDGRGAILALNPAAERMFGRATAEVVGRALADVIVPAADRARGRAAIERHFARSEASVVGARIELTAVRADGSVFPAEVSVARVNHDDAPTYTSFIRDLSDAQRARAELVRSNERLQVIARVSQAFAQVTTSYEALLARVAQTTAELVGDGCLIMLVSDDGRQLVTAASAHRDPARGAAYHRHVDRLALSIADSTSSSVQVVRDGRARRGLTSPAETASEPCAILDVQACAVVPIRARDRVIGTLAMVRTGPGSYSEEDETLLSELADRAGLAIDNARLYGALEARVRDRTRAMELVNRELESFSYSVAHDLRGPLRGIAGFSQALLEDYRDRLDATGVDHLTRIDASARRMGDLIDDLLQLAKVSRVELRRGKVDLSERARGVIAGLRAHEPGREVEVRLADGVIVDGDRALLDVVLANLLGNAWKFTSKTAGARIELAVEPTIPPRYVVRDNGAGFDAAYAGKLFGVFERLHTTEEFEGTGIGLAIVQRIIDRHGGRVWAEGRVGAGATISFTLGPADQ